MAGIRLKFSGLSHIIFRNYMYYNILAYIAVVILVMNEVEDGSRPPSASFTFTLMMSTAVVAKKFEWLQHTMQLNHIPKVIHNILKNITPVILGGGYITTIMSLVTGRRLISKFCSNCRGTSLNAVR